MKLDSRFSKSELHSSLFLLIFLVNLKCGYIQPYVLECDWFVQRLSCPPYATTDWYCLKTQLNCTNSEEYHCLRDENEEWTEICAKPIKCSKGQEPVLKKNSHIVCTNCKNPERYEPVDGTESYKYSECRRIKTSCPRGVSYECPVDETVRHAQNRQCRCAYEKDYMPQNYDLNSDTWICKEPDDMNCIHAPCPEDVYGNEQTRGSDYRCTRLPIPVTATPSKKPTKRTSPYIVTQAPTRPDVPKEQTEGSPNWITGVTVGILSAMIIICLIYLAVGWQKNRKQSGAPVSLEATDMSFFELHLSWQPPQKGNLPTHYILEQREANSLIWVRIDTISAENNTEYNVKGLKAGTLYRFRVIAKFVKGQSRPCETESAVRTKSIMKPRMPQGLSGCFDEDLRCVVLRWDEIDNGGSEIFEIIVEYVTCLDDSPSDEEWVLLERITENLKTWTTINRTLTGGVVYKFRVLARNAEGTSEPAITEKIKYLDVPGKPLDVYIMDISFTKLILNWVAPASDGGSIINRYYIRQKQGKDDWQNLHEVMPSRDSKQSKSMVVKLTPLKEYFFGVSAKNRIGNGDFKDMELPIVLLRNRGPPESPIGPLNVSNIGYSQLTLAWQPPDNRGGLRIIEYTIEKRENRWEKVGSISTEKTEYLVQGLKDGTLYSFRVMAKNSKGSSIGLETIKPVATLSVTEPSKPVGPLELTNMTWKSVTLKWKPPDNNGGSPVTGYNIYYCKEGDRNWTRGGSLKNNKSGDLEKPEWTLAILTLDCNYWFRVEAKNAKGTSQSLDSTEFYNPQQYISPPGAPASVDFKIMKDSSLLATWKAPMENGGSNVQKYHVAYRTEESDWEEYSVVDHSKYCCKVEKLSFDVNYFFAVWAENQKGMGDWEETKSPIAISKTGSPGTPTGPLEVTYIDATSITLSWHSPGGGYPVSDYLVYMKEENKKWNVYSSAVAEKITIRKLKQEKKYLFKVVACYQKAESAPLEMKDYISTQMVIVPRPPTGPILYSDLTQSSVTLTWRPPDKESSPVNGYKIEYLSNKDLDWKEAGFETTRTSWTQSNLLKDCCYHFRVVSVNLKGESEPLESDIEIKPLREPDKPESIMVIDVIDYQVKLKWRPPSDNGGTEVQYYHVFLQQDNSNWKAVGRVRSDETEFVTEILRPGEYLFGICAQNSIGCGNMIESSSYTVIAKKPGVPDIPSGQIEITDVTAQTVTLKWYPPQDEGDSPLELYKVYETHDNKDWNRLEIIVPPSTSYKAKGLKEGKGYKFSVIAKNKQGKGARLVSKTVVPCKEGNNGGNCRRDRAHSLTDKSGGDEKGETSTTEEEKDTKALDLLKDLKSITLWDDFLNKANVLDSYTKALGFLAETATQISGSPTMKVYHEGSKSLPGGLTAYECPDYGNSLFNSVSLILFGNTSHAYRFRLLAAAEGIAQLSFYKTTYFGARNKKEVTQLIHSFFSNSSLEGIEEVREDEIRDIAIRIAVRETAMPESKCNPLQVQFLSSATGFHIKQHYEKQSEDFYGNVIHENEDVEPKLSRQSTKKSSGREKSYIHILWVSESPRNTAGRKRINRAYPVIKKEDRTTAN